MDKYLLDFNSFVSELVNYHLKMKKSINISKLSEKLGVSISFFQKALNTPTDKHFNLRHIFLISQALNMSVEKFLPSKENYRLITNKDLTDEEWYEFLFITRKEKE